MVILFDINGTLLDTHALAPKFRTLFGGRYPVSEWFAEVIQYSMALTLAGTYQEFGEIAIAVLKSAAAARQVRLDRGDIQQARETMQSLPPFPEVPVALNRLRAAGYRLGALSNSSAAALQKQLWNAKLDGFLEQAISVSRVRKFKPAPEVYREAARVLDVRTSDMLLAAAHPWDLLGAAKAGYRTALITRPGKAPMPSLLEPDLVAADLEDFAGQILSGAAHPQSSSGQSTSGALLLVTGLAALGIAGTLLAKGSRERARKVVPLP